MKSAVRLQLSFMMFLEFFIWGAWFVTLGTFVLKNLQDTNATQVSVAFLTQSIGAVIAPFIVGIIADRFISAQVILGAIHIVGSALLWICSGMQSFDSFYPLLLLYMILYMPTLALVNSISFRQMTDPSKEFSSIRVFGTVGWIIAGLLIGWLNWEKQNHLDATFKMAAAASLLLGLFSFSLPKTPPAKKGTKVSVREILGLDAIRMLKDSSYRLFFIASIAICVPLAFYYNFTNPFLNEIGMEAAAGKQSMGQISELLFMLVMPLFFARLGVKKMLALGMLAWVIRYACFAYGNIDSNYWMLIAGIVLHGICYDFFFVTGQIYTDKMAGEEFKSSAQGFVTLATYGVGMLFGFLISGPIVEARKIPGGHNWQGIWLIPAGIAAVVLVLFLLLFKDSSKPAGSKG
ncbi:MFS transporter [Chitinophaga nivalis]|uniref:MFS transporter n=1 Tax=Chitinophaga nivalis TaxID=2991709 RepID=A0ABT3IWQ7_9BACT|nr:MFS transporter [Chitinophaga nivalis]MCW3461978.1 MFS transporter [Chitinophaga nivalis]MCW3488331.1 MFS transporter [Chitinophaga nivalis]